MAPPPFLFLSLRNSLANPSIENWPLGKDESNFVSVIIKTSMLFLIIYLKLVSAIFYQIFMPSPNDSFSKTIKNVFYFI